MRDQDIGDLRVTGDSSGSQQEAAGMSQRRRPDEIVVCLRFHLHWQGRRCLNTREPSMDRLQRNTNTHW